MYHVSAQGVDGRMINALLIIILLLLFLQRKLHKCTSENNLSSNLDGFV